MKYPLTIASMVCLALAWSYEGLVKPWVEKVADFAANKAVYEHENEMKHTEENNLS